jgi:TRAP-type C4-dicarboxylate transport system permease small subunit
MTDAAHAKGRCRVMRVEVVSMLFVRKLIALFYRLIELTLILSMVVMFVLVLGNVILRSAFNSGWDIAEELPRFLFVWMTFLGAIVAMRDRAHIAVHIVTNALPMAGKKICWGICQVLIIVCCCYMFYGTWLQHDIIYYNESPVMNLSMLYVFGVSYIASVAIALDAITNLARLLLGRVQDSELIQEYEDEVSAEVKP